MPQGRGLVYRSNASTWTVATVSTEPDFAVEGREVFLQTDNVTLGLGLEYSVSQDDERLLVIKNLEQDIEGRLTVVTNFFEELRQRMPN